MRNVLKNSAEVAHAWANGIDREVRSGNVYTSHDGQTIYSYGSHFPMGKFCEHDGNRFVVLNPNTYGPTTSKHQGEARYALSGVTIVYGVPEDENHKATIYYYSNELEGLLTKLEKARKKEKWEDQIRGVQGRIEYYFTAFGLPVPPELNIELVMAQHEAGKPQREEDRAQQRQREAEYEAQKRAQIARKATLFYDEYLPKWRSGENTNNSLYNRPEVFFSPKGKAVTLDYMRPDRDSYIVTSQSVAIPKPACRALWNLLMQLPADFKPGEHWQGKPVEVSGYPLVAFTPHYVTFRCHTFTWDELRNAAKLVSADRPDRRHPIEEAVTELA